MTKPQKMQQHRARSGIVEFPAGYKTFADYKAVLVINLKLARGIAKKQPHRAYLLAHVEQQCRTAGVPV